MKVLLRQNVRKLGQIGDVVDVRPGYARNYLIPQGIGMVPSEANLKAIEAEKQAYLQELAKQRAELEARAKMLEGKEVTITARANEEGHLYGSVGPAQIVAAMAKEGVFLEVEEIVLDEPIRRLDKYEVTVRLAAELETTIGVWVVPPKEAAEDEGPPAGEAPAQPSGESPAEPAGESASIDPEGEATA